MKKVWEVLGITLAMLAVIVLCAYFLVLRYPELKNDPKVGKWYRVSDSSMKDSEGHGYHALFKKGSENKVMVYFAGGGASLNEETARHDTYNTRLGWPDMLANTTMNMGGLATAVEGSPFRDWTLILFPYATGDFHCGTGAFRYTDTDGKEKTLYHNGYMNYTAAMEKILEKADIADADTVLVTGYSAGGFAAALLSDDVSTHYFPNVLVDASLLLYEGWHDVAVNVWKTPQAISDMLVSDNLTLDCFRALHEKYGDGVHLFFDSSTRDGDLAKMQNYLDTGVMEVDEAQADEYQRILKETIPQFQAAGVSLFIWDGVAWYDDPRNMTAHTVIATPAVWLPFEDQDQSISGWLWAGIQGEARDYGLELADKQY